MDLPSGPVAKTLHLNAGDFGSIAGQGTKPTMLQIRV